MLTLNTYKLFQYFNLVSLQLQQLIFYFILKEKHRPHYSI